MTPNDVGLDPRYATRTPDPVREPAAWAAAFEPRVPSFSIAFGQGPLAHRANARKAQRQGGAHGARGDR